MNKYILVSSSNMKPWFCYMCSHPCMYDCVCVCVCLLRSVSRISSDKTQQADSNLEHLQHVAYASSHTSPQHFQHIFILKHRFFQLECDISCLRKMFRCLKGPIVWYSSAEKGERVLPVTTLGIFVMKLFAVLMGTPAVSSWMRVTMSSICRRSQRKYSSSRLKSRWNGTNVGTNKWVRDIRAGDDIQQMVAITSHSCFDDDACSSSQMLFYLVLKSGSLVAL